MKKRAIKIAHFCPVGKEGENLKKEQAIVVDKKCLVLDEKNTERSSFTLFFLFWFFFQCGKSVENSIESCWIVNVDG